MTAFISDTRICSPSPQRNGGTSIRTSARRSDSRGIGDRLSSRQGRPAVARQQGASLILMLALICVGVAGFLITVRLAPVYMEAWTVRAVISSLDKEHGLRGANAQEITRTLDRRFTINDVRSLRARDIEVRSVPGGMAVVADYEVRVELLGNIDGVVKFRYETVISE